MLAEDDPFTPLLNTACSFNCHGKVDLETSLEWPPEQPFAFYDQHLDANLLLKCVKRLPLLPSYLSKSCDTAISTFLEGGHRFYHTGYRMAPTTGTTIYADARSVGHYYYEYVGALSSSLASKIVLFPHRPTWESALAFVVFRHEGPRQGFLGEGALKIICEEDPPHNLQIVSKLRDEMDESTFARLQDLARKFPRLATWELFPMTKPASHILKKMDEVLNFDWQIPHTTGFFVEPSLPRPVDAKAGNVRKFLISKLNFSRTSKNRQRTVPLSDSNMRPDKICQIFVPSRTGEKSGRPYRPNFKHFLQRAWSRAVINDATFIIFHCGNFERIGIRHRETQTLFLSDLIDTTKCKDPAYGKIHIGLHITVIEDALERQQEADIAIKGNKKRKADKVEPDIPCTASKRQKGSRIRGGSHRRIESRDIEHEMGLRDLALIRLSYGPYRSSAPSSFIRLGSSCVPAVFDPSFKEPKRKSKYRPHEYFVLTLREPLGRGAIGVAHPALVTLDLMSNSTLQGDIVVKLAFSDEQQDKLRKEYSIYQHLASVEGVEGIVPVHGLFRDMDTGILALLMDHAGTNLRTREKERLGTQGPVEQISTSPEERETFMRVLKSIHKAGVRHRDLRADNATINSEGQCFIIDFDCAELNPSEKRLKWELSCMQNMLNGAFDDPDSVYMSP